MSKKPKTTVISVRMPFEKREAVEKVAVTAGTTVRAFVLSAVERAMLGSHGATALRSQAVPDETGQASPVASGISLSDPAALAELKRIGINVNQIAHGLNAGVPQGTRRIVGAFRELFELLAERDAFKSRLDAVAPLLAEPVAEDARPSSTAPPISPVAINAPRPLPIQPPTTAWTCRNRSRARRFRASRSP